jgi:tight adherence protein B
MLAAVLAFVVSLVIVLGAYALFVVMPDARSARQLKGRLKPETATAPVRGELMRRAAPLSALKGLDGLLGKAGLLVDPLRRAVEDSGLAITTGVVILGAVFLASVSALVVYTLSASIWASAAAAIAVGAVPFFYVQYAAAQRVRQFEEQFPQAVDLIASALRAGHAFTTGVSMVADEVADPTGAEFRLVYDQQNYGMPLSDALKAFAKRVPLLDARFFIIAVLTQREAGGNLAEVLDNLSALIRERSRVKRQVRVASAHGRITGWILSMMPPALAGIMMLLAPEHLRAFIEDPLGVRMIVAAGVLQLIGVFTIRRIVNVEF